MEHRQSYYVHDQPNYADCKDNSRLLQVFRLKQSRNGVHKESEAERQQEHAVDEGAQQLGPNPAERIGTSPSGSNLKRTHPLGSALTLMQTRAMASARTSLIM